MNRRNYCFKPLPRVMHPLPENMGAPVLGWLFAKGWWSL